ncbi:MAG: ATP synthase F0 subunit B [Candidatus Dadabacteria bacterium]|nr:ATP synthase F0 subunit B [Candidatus Dadabacteria bacterium]NIS07929.1 ATP synthase F0 subunit B [Candidatus Dadabacteria bacterium]NIY21513.1 hypothetical protein [Candidatus Dadabacteria bacterium]
MVEIESLISLAVTMAGGGADAFNWEYVGKHSANLALLIIVLAYFLKTPIKNFLMERRGQIASKIESSEKEITEAKALFDEYMAKMNNLEKEVNDLKESIKSEAELERQEIIKQAEISAQKIREDAKETIKSETAKAKHQIQGEVVELAMELAENLIKSNLNESDSKRIIEDFVREVNETKWQQ